MSKTLLQQRKARGAKPKGEALSSRVENVLLSKTGSQSTCRYCYAEPTEPCVNMTTGESLPDNQMHVKRRDVVSYARFRSADSNRLTAEGIEAEVALNNFWGRKDQGEDVQNAAAAERLRFDPPERSIIGKEGGYVTFAGSQQSVDGAHKTLRPGETYYAKWAPDTVEGWTKHGQFLVTINTERGPAWLFPDEYVALEPAHLWYLVQDGTLKFTPSEGLGKQEFGERVHYVRSRGISLEKSVLMCLGDIKTDIGFFTPKDNFDAMWWRFQSVGLTPMQKDAIAEALAQARNIKEEAK